MLLSFFQALEVILTKPLLANSSVVSFNIGVLLRFAGLDLDDLNIALSRPDLTRGADVFWALINADCFRSSSPLDDLVQHSSDALCWQ